MTDRATLARIFGFEPLRPWGPAAVAAGVSWMPGMWMATGGIAIGVTALIIHENRRIAAGLAEVERWGWPVSGYRGWLLASEPAFDIELKRDVAIDLIADSLRAVDASIRSEKRGERVVRVYMRRVELDTPNAYANTLVGDRKRLFEVGERVLAPLHADVGIVTMNMGDAPTLAALVAGTAAAVAETAFRDQGAVAPPELQSLVHAGTSQLAPPAEASTLKARTDRLLYATGQMPRTAGHLTWAVLGLTLGGGIVTAGAGLGFLVGGGAGTLLAWAMRRGDVAKLDRFLESLTKGLPFPVTGIENWLLSGRPILDIELVEPAPAAFAGFPSRPTWLSDRVARFETDPTMHMAAQGIPSFWGGNPGLLEVFLRALKDVHVTHPIAAVRMGGYVDRRA